MPTTLRPPYISNENQITLDQLIALSRELILTESEIQYLKAIFRLVEIHGRELAMSELLDENVKSLSGVRKRLNTLAEKGAMTLDKRKIPSVRKPVSVYRFKKLTMAGLISQSREQAPSGATRSSSEVSKEHLSYDPAYEPFLKDPAIDDLICSVLYTALDYNRKGREKEIDIVVDWYGDKVRVIASCQHRSDLVVARITDLKYYIAILTLAEEITAQSIMLGKTPTNFFKMDTKFINAFLGKANEGGNIATLIEAMRRLNSTEFHVPALPQRIIERYGFTSGSMSLTPISDFANFHDDNPNGSRRSVVFFSLPAAIFQGILSDRINVFRINPEVLKEKNEVIFGLHLFCRRRIGHKASYNHRVTLEQLRMQVAPNMTKRAFASKLFDGLAAVHLRQVAQSERDPRRKMSLKPVIYNVQKPRSNEIIGFYASVHGYYVGISGQNVSIHIDSSDPYVGVKSRARQLKGKTALLSKIEDESSIADIDVDSLKDQYDIFK